MANWYDEVFNEQIRLGLRIKKTLFSGKSAWQTIDVFDSEPFGRTLALDGILQTSEGDERFYHEMLAQVAMCTAPRIHRVLVIGGGDGGTAREVLRHSEVESCTMVEIDQMVVDVSKEHLPTIGSAWDDPRLDLIIGDGIEFVANADAGSFDVVILDGSDPVGPSEGLFNRDFYAAVARVLAPEGVFALQSESPVLMGDIFTAIQSALADFFPLVKPYLGWVPIYGTAMWSWTVAARAVDLEAPMPSRVRTIADQCEVYNADIHRAAFALPSFVQRALRVGKRDG